MDRLTDLATGFQRLEDRITQRVDGLTGQFLPRDEYEARHSDVRNQITKLDARLDAEATKLDSRLDAEAIERKALEEKLTTRIDEQSKSLTQQRRFAITTFFTAVLVIVGLLTLIYNIVR